MKYMDIKAFTEAYWLIAGDNGSNEDLEKRAMEYYPMYEFAAWSNWYKRGSEGYLTDVAIIDGNKIRLCNADKAVRLLIEQKVRNAIYVIADTLLWGNSDYVDSKGHTVYVRLPTGADYETVYGNV